VGVTRRVFFLGFILVLGLPAAGSATRTDCAGSTAGGALHASLISGPARGDAYREAVLRIKQEFHVPGVVAGVWFPGKKPWKIAEGVGDVESGTPIGLDDHFPIRSATKSFTVTLILQLVRSKTISLDDPIEKYVPDIPNGNEITLAQLAAMESGVKDYSGVEEFLSALEEDPGWSWTPQELVDLAKPYSPVFAPGAEYAYSNTNTILLGMVVEKVTQQAIAETYRKRIFKPLGLRETSYPNNTNIPSPHPTPYEVAPVTGEPSKSPTVNLSVFGASGGMVSTLEDLRRWGKALGKGQLIGSRLQKTRLEHSRPATGGPEYDRYGLGIGELKGWWGHTGEGLGYQAATFYDPKTGAVISVLVNSSQHTNVATEVFKALADLVHPHGAGDDTTP
jgi:D-alanyl-D-alanine carboxypeptidase